MLTIAQLWKRHGAREVLKGVSLQLDTGRVGVVIGPSGSGKSTLLRCVNGLEDFQQGEISVGESRLSADTTPRQRREQLQHIRGRVGMVFQQFNLFPHLSVLENVIEAPRYVRGEPHDQAVAAATALLDRVGLGDRLQSMPHQLSGGQQQRVAIARALAMKPELMLFDEPTSALDPRMTAEVLSVMIDLAKAGQSMLVVTHAMGFARKAAHQVHVIADGVIVESGPPEQVFESPRDERTKDFLHEVSQV